MFRFIVFFFLILTCNTFAQVKPVRFNELAALQEKEEKLVMVFIYTDWCKYCKAMRQTMLNNKKIADLLSKRFYTLFFDAESTERVVFADKTFGFRPTGVNTGVHQLAEQLGTINGQLSFPSLCFLNRKNEIVYQYSGFLDPQSLFKLLTALGKELPST